MAGRSVPSTLAGSAATARQGAKRIETPIGKARCVAARARGLIAARTLHDPARGGLACLPERAGLHSRWIRRAHAALNEAQYPRVVTSDDERALYEIGDGRPEPSNVIASREALAADYAESIEVWRAELLRAVQSSGGDGRRP
jgi:hypothetical protein